MKAENVEMNSQTEVLEVLDTEERRVGIGLLIGEGDLRREGDERKERKGELVEVERRRALSTRPSAILELDSNSLRPGRSWE